MAANVKDVVVSIADMIDLAIGTPEIGVVDFIMLQTVLHCLAQQLRCSDKNVELRGPLAAIPVPRHPDQATTIAVDEFLMQVDGKPPRKYEYVPDTIDDDMTQCDSQESLDMADSQRWDSMAVNVGDKETTTERDTQTTSSSFSSSSTQTNFTAIDEEKNTLANNAFGALVGHELEASEDEDTILVAERILKSARKPLPKKKTAIPAKPTQGPPAPSGAAAGAESDGTMGQEGGLETTSTQGLEGAVGTPSTIAQAAAADGTQGGTPGEAAGQRLSLVTLNKFNLLENTVADLKERVYGSIPKNEQILEEVRSQTNLKAITDMWTSLNVSSRLEAAEKGLGTLSALLQDLIVKSGGSAGTAGSKAISSDGKPGTDLSSRLAAAEKNIDDLTSLLQNLIAQGLVSEAQLQTVLSKMYEALSSPTSGYPVDASGQLTPDSGQAAPGSGQSAPGSGQAAPGSGQTAPGSGPAAPGSGQAAPGSGRTAPSSGQAAPGSGPTAPGSGQTAPGSGQTAPGSGQAAPGFGQQATGYGQPAAGSGQPMSGSGQVQAMMNAAKAMAPPAQLNLDCLKLCKEDFLRLEAFQIELSDGLEHLSNAFYDAMQKMNHKVAEPPRRISIAKSPAPPAHAAHTASTTSAPARPTSGRGPMDSSLAKKLNDNSEKIKELEHQLDQINKIVITPKGNVLEQLLALQDRVDYYLREKTATDGGPPLRVPPVHHVPPDPASALAFSHPPTGLPQGFTGGQNIPPAVMKDIQGLMTLFNTVESMQSQLQQVHETALQLAAESEDRQLNIDALLEQIELLKAIKLDREDMVEALADKADLRMLARKVSHDQFEMACDDLSRGLEQALGKFNLQEALWQQALDDIQREIETKLDKMELSPVKDFFNNKLKLLQENLKKLAQLRREAEAAGTKKKLFTDVNCISCDAKAYMPTDPPSAVPPKPLIPTKSMKPYLSYELDAIRKAQSSALPQRNMHDWEKIDRQMTSKQPQRVRSDTGKHICNRYCGGSHTTTTPAQRVARLGHFVKQWGPEVLPLSAGYAMGDDGRQYKVSGTETANVGPGGAVDASARSFAKKFEQKQAASSTKQSGALDCRCLEDIFPLSPKKERK